MLTDIMVTLCIGPNCRGRKKAEQWLQDHGVKYRVAKYPEGCFGVPVLSIVERMIVERMIVGFKPEIWAKELGIPYAD